MKIYVKSSEEEAINVPQGCELRKFDGGDLWICVPVYDVARDVYNILKSNFAKDINHMLGVDLLKGPVHYSGVSEKGDKVSYELDFETSIPAVNEPEGYCSLILDAEGPNENKGVYSATYDGVRGILEDSNHICIIGEFLVGVSATQDSQSDFKKLGWMFPEWKLKSHHMLSTRDFYDQILTSFKSLAKHTFEVAYDTQRSKKFAEQLLDRLNDDLWNDVMRITNCPVEWYRSNRQESYFVLKTEEDNSTNNYSYFEIWGYANAYDDKYVISGRYSYKEFKLKSAPISVVCQIDPEKEKDDVGWGYYSTACVYADFPAYYKSDSETNRVMEEMEQIGVDGWYDRILNCVCKYIQTHMKSLQELKESARSRKTSRA